MSVGLRGALKDFGIAEVFQLIGQQRKTGLLEIEHRKTRVALLFDQGAVVSASPVGAHPDEALGDMLARCGLLTRDRLEQLEQERGTMLQTLPRLLEERGILSASAIEEIVDLLTRETIFEVLRWTEGSFRFSARTVEHERDPSKLLPAEQILIDGLRMVDEWRTFAEEVPSGEVVFQRVGRFEDYRAQASGDARRRLAWAEELLRLIDGRLSARRLIDLSRLGTFEATRLLADLRRGGVIAPVDRPKRRRGARRERVDLSRGRVRAWIATAAPLAALFVLAAAALAGASLRVSRAEPGGYAIRRDVLRAARLAIQTEQVRSALEAHRFETGRWPESLEALARDGWIEPDALAGPEGRPYYYARRGEGILLLAPEH